MKEHQARATKMRCNLVGQQIDEKVKQENNTGRGGVSWGVMVLVEFQEVLTGEKVGAEMHRRKGGRLLLQDSQSNV